MCSLQVMLVIVDELIVCFFCWLQTGAGTAKTERVWAAVGKATKSRTRTRRTAQKGSRTERGNLLSEWLSWVPCLVVYLQFGWWLIIGCVMVSYLIASLPVTEIHIWCLIFHHGMSSYRAPTCKVTVKFVRSDWILLTCEDKQAIWLFAVSLFTDKSFCRDHTLAR